MKRKIVVVNDFPIYPPRFGGQFRIYNLYKNLSRWFDITYICFSYDNRLKETEFCQNFRGIEIPKSRIHSNINAFLGKIFGKAVDDIVAMFLCRSNIKMDHTIRDHIAKSEIIIVSHPYMYPSVEKYTKNKILIHESLNVEYILKKAILGDGFFKKFLYNRVKKIEGDLIRKSDLMFTVSELDMYKIQDIYKMTNKKMYISPNGVDISAYDILYKNGKLEKEKIIKYPIAIFMASGHPPNTEAAEKIINEIAPKMKGLYFLICGSVCWNIKDYKVGGNIGLTFDVSEEEKLELYRVSDIALNPILSGSGTNIKMLDYMAAELPIITTPTGARGLDIKNYDDAIICDILEFPEKILEVLEDRDLYDKLGSNGRKLAEEKYDWTKIAGDMAKILEDE